MKIKVLGCYGGNVPGHGMTSFLVNGTVALDAGSISDALSLEDQEKVKDIFISHSHLDHTASLPFIIDNNFSAPGFSLRIYAIKEVIASMKNHLFNNHTWPDFTCLPNNLTPVLKLMTIEEDVPVEVNGLKIRAVRVSHTVPTTGFIVDDGKGVLGFTSDTGPTKRFWDVVNGIRRLKAVITEVSFPNELQNIADVSGHLTPQSLGAEVKKLKRDVPIYLYGRKPRHVRIINHQLKALHEPRLKLLAQGRTYTV
jgi:ribonuclease BN (tRNA processing enzyme)